MIVSKLELAGMLDTFTWHSLRVTVLNAAVHAGADALSVSMQANHANTDLVVKYTRDRSQVPLQMVGQLFEDLRKGWSPAPLAALPNAAAVNEFSEDEPEELFPQFYVRKGIVQSRSIEHPKFHVTSENDLSRLACNKVDLSLCEPLGVHMPDSSVMCKSCMRRRKDIWPKP